MDIVVTILKSEYKNADIESAAMEQDSTLVKFWTLAVAPRHLKWRAGIFKQHAGRSWHRRMT
ncbi:hypothetical protein [Halalkalibacter oceani]|uniref:hypothetical protein n=1 Tax=Halalkalibacter oceani TaxID=1653776 RepID=UPI003392F47A